MTARFSAINYTVVGGETLKTIARTVLGDSSLWWRIAEANGLAISGDGELKAGQTLSIPKLALNANNADTFQPYDPSRVTGSLDSVLPAPAAQGGGCGGLGKIIMVAVAVVVSAYTAGTFSTLLGNTWAGAAASGAAGSIASQAAGNLLGVQDGFSWKSVALSALSAGITKGLGGTKLLGGTDWQSAAMRAATANAMTQGIGVVTGLQDRFDWKSVAASAAGGAVGSYVDGQLKGSTMFSDWNQTAAGIARGTISGFAAGTAAAVARGGRISVQQVAADAFGNALGSSLASASHGVQTQGQGPWSDADYRNGSDIQSDNAYLQRQAQPYLDQVVEASSGDLSDMRDPGVQLAANFNPKDFSGGFIDLGDGSGRVVAPNGDIVQMPQGAVSTSISPGRSAVSLERSLNNIPEMADAYRASSYGAGDPYMSPDPVRALSEVRVAEPRMTQAEMDEFDRLNPGVADAARVAQYGSMSAYQPSVWERTGLSPDVRHVMNNTITGKVVGGLLNMAGSIAASVRSDRYNFATGKYLNPVEQRNAQIDNLINLVALPFGGGTIGARSGLQGMRAARFGNTANGAVDLATSRGTWGGMPATPAAQSFAEQLVRPGDMVPLPRGAMGLQDLGSLASSEGAEFAVIRLKGDRYIVRGTANTTTIPEGSSLIGHVHPGEGFMGLAPSVEDMNALGLLNQGRSAIFNESGAWRTFGPNGPSSSVFMPKTKPGS